MTDHNHDNHSDHVHSAMNHDHSNHSEHHSMAMYFHCGVSEVILFSFWKTCSWPEFLGSVVGLFLLAILYEGLKSFRETLLQSAYYKQSAFESISNHSPPCSAVIDQTESSSHAHRTMVGGGGTAPFKVLFKLKPLSVAHAVQSVLHVTQLLLSYLLMLVVMTYNVWLFLAVIFGSGVGYFLFGWKRTSVMDACEHCH